jgi:HEAT repeat protein
VTYRRTYLIAILVGLAAAGGGRAGDEPKIEGKTIREWLTNNSDTRKVAEVGEPAVKPLIALLADKDKTLRERACEALEDLGPKARPAARDLARLVRTDPAGAVRHMAASALKEIQPGKEVVPDLVAFLAKPRDPAYPVKGTSARYSTRWPGYSARSARTRSQPSRT